MYRADTIQTLLDRLQGAPWHGSWVPDWAVHFSRGWWETCSVEISIDSTWIAEHFRNEHKIQTSVTMLLELQDLRPGTVCLLTVGTSTIEFFKRQLKTYFLSSLIHNIKCSWGVVFTLWHYRNHKNHHIYIYIYIYIYLLSLSLVMRYSQSKFAWPWLWPLECAKVKYIYIIRKPISNFLYMSNSNICCICHHLWDIQSVFAWPWLWSLEWAKVKCRHTILKANKGLPTCS